MMCKHYNTQQGCSYGDKCQFAHGVEQLRTFMGQIPQSQLEGNPNGIPPKNFLKNPLNYKIVKCKNFEKTGTCKYGSRCTFAHGDDLRTKADNLNQIQPSLNNMMNANMMNPNFMYDYNMAYPGMAPVNGAMGGEMNNPQMPMDVQMNMNPMFDPRTMFMMGMNPQDQPMNPQMMPEDTNEQEKETKPENS